MMVKQTPQKPLSAQTQPFSHYLQETPEILGPTKHNPDARESHTNDQAKYRFKFRTETELSTASLSPTLSRNLAVLTSQTKEIKAICLNAFKTSLKNIR